MLEVPARVLPVPDTVSPQMQALIARPVNPRHSLSPQTAAERKKIVEEAARTVTDVLRPERNHIAAARACILK
jgi:hypothetical protein